MSYHEHFAKVTGVKQDLSHHDTNENDSDDDEAIEFDKRRFRSNSQISYEGGEDRVEKSRERNREHAKKTRLRKKIMLESLKGRLLELQTEASKLQLALEENNTANILLCLGERNGDVTDKNAPSADYSIPETAPALAKGNIIDQLRNIVRAEAAIFLKPKFESSLQQLSSASAALSTASSHTTNLSPESHEDDGHFSDDEESDLVYPSSSALPTKTWKDGSVTSEKIGNEDMDVIRKERNRMHAKLTRDRKKMFTSRLQQMINALERQNLAMRNRLQMQVQSQQLHHHVHPQQQTQSQQPHMSAFMQPMHSNFPPAMSHLTAPIFMHPHYGNPTLLQTLGLPHNFNMSQAMNMAPPMNVNAYAPLALKRKAHETVNDLDHHKQQQQRKVHATAEEVK